MDSPIDLLISYYKFIFGVLSQLPTKCTKALSTLIRFQTKTELFCSVFKKICGHAYRFRIVFARPHYNAVSVSENAFIPSVHILK